MKRVVPLDRPFFTLGEACELAGADPRRLTVWIQRGMHPAGDQIGPRKRLFSTWEVLQLSVLTRLVSFNISVETAASWATSAVEQFRAARPLKATTLNALRAELERGGDTLGLFVFREIDTARPVVQGMQSTLSHLQSTTRSAGEGASTPTLMVPITQLLFAMVQVNADALAPDKRQVEA